MTRTTMFALMALAIFSQPARADPPDDKPLPGERINGEGQDNRTNKRIDTRLPTRLETRVTRRTIEAPLATATSRITADANNGCSKSNDANASQRCGQPQ
jgi:hypothetical protein